MNWRGGAAGLAASGRKRNEKLLAGLSRLLQSMECEEEEEADADLLTDLKNLVRTKPGNLLKALTELVARHSVAPSRAAEENDWTVVSRKKPPKTRQVVLRPSDPLHVSSKGMSKGEGKGPAAALYAGLKGSKRSRSDS